MSDPVNHPDHYTAGPACPCCGTAIECITVTERMDFCLGNATKYIWRAGLKGDALTDLKKARWYLDRAIAGLDAQPQPTPGVYATRITIEAQDAPVTVEKDA